ncbi:MAG: hypothetical protein RID07_08150, partial [Lacipirellulaceae bacterium]
MNALAFGVSMPCRDRKILLGYAFTALAIGVVLFYVAGSLIGLEYTRIEGGAIFAIAYISFGAQAMLNYLAGNKVWLPFGDHLIDAPEEKIEDGKRWPIAIFSFM